jgi:hypothetical protein
MPEPHQKRKKGEARRRKAKRTKPVNKAEEPAISEADED